MLYQIMQKLNGRHIHVDTINGSVLVAVPGGVTLKLLLASASLNLATGALLLWREVQSFLL